MNKYRFLLSMHLHSRGVEEEKDKQKIHNMLKGDKSHDENKAELGREAYQ